MIFHWLIPSRYLLECSELRRLPSKIAFIISRLIGLVAQFCCWFIVQVATSISKWVLSVQFVLCSYSFLKIQHAHLFSFGKNIFRKTNDKLCECSVFLYRYTVVYFNHLIWIIYPWILLWVSDQTLSIETEKILNLKIQIYLFLWITNPLIFIVVAWRWHFFVAFFCAFITIGPLTGLHVNRLLKHRDYSASGGVLREFLPPPFLKISFS